MSDDFFGTPPTAQTPPTPPGGAPQQAVPPPGYSPMMGWVPPAGSAPLQASPAVTISQSALAAIAAAVAGLLTCLGAWGPWLHISGPEGFGSDLGGLHSELDGKWVLAVGVIGVALALVLYTMPAGSQARSGIGIVLAILGVIGLVVAVHQYVSLSDRLSAFNGAFQGFGGIHAGAGWGLWLAGFGSAGLGATGVLSLVL